MSKKLVVIQNIRSDGKCNHPTFTFHFISRIARVTLCKKIIEFFNEYFEGSEGRDSEGTTTLSIMVEIDPSEFP